MNIVTRWFKHYFSDPQVVVLALLLVVGFALVLIIGEMMAPVLGAAILAYLLEGAVQRMEHWGVPRVIAASIMFLIFVAILMFVLFVLVPVTSRQLTQVVSEIPSMIAQAEQYLMSLPEQYPDMFSTEQVSAFIASLGAELTGGDKGSFLTQSIKVGLSTAYLMIYIALIPFMVFFMLKDKDKMLAWFQRFLPTDNRLAASVWKEVDLQIGNYVRGKVIEIGIIGGVCYAVFTYADLNYALLLSALVGLSVLMPYIGATLVTIPVVVVAYFDTDTSFMLVFVSYMIIQILDGNVLVPLLFGEVVDIHPVGIIAAILLFGGLWGFWGVFFAIPLATLVQAVIRAWPRRDDLKGVVSEDFGGVIRQS